MDLVSQALEPRGTPRRQRERELHPPADVDERVGHPELLDELANREFLEEAAVSEIIKDALP